MKAVALLENTAPQGLTGEHGLSLYLETGPWKILFDAGQTGAFADNAGKLGVDLAQVDFGVLSHGHYDHGGGLGRFLECNASAPVYASASAFHPHRNSSGKDIGVEATLPRHRLVFSREGQELAPGIRLVTLNTPPEDSGGMTALEDGQWIPEDFRHEQYLLVEEAGKRILISGCSHKGIVSIAEHFRPDILVGGFHFMNIRDPEILKAAAERLLALNTCYYTGHCTGAEQFAVLKEAMGNRLQEIITGTVVEF